MSFDQTFPKFSHTLMPCTHKPLATMKSFWCLTLSSSYNTVGPYICIYTTRPPVHIHLYLWMPNFAQGLCSSLYICIGKQIFKFKFLILFSIFIYIYIKCYPPRNYSAIVLERFIRNFSCKGIFCRILLTILTTSEILNEIFWTLIFSFAKLNFVNFQFFGFSLLQNLIFGKF